jgi:uroporphyrinogen-III synthase
MVRSHRRAPSRYCCNVNANRPNTFWIAILLIYIMAPQWPAVNSYILRTPKMSTTSFSFVRSFRPTLPTSIYNSNDDDDEDSIDRDMGRIGWGKTVLSEALLGTTNSANEYVMSDSTSAAEILPSADSSTATIEVDTPKIAIGIALTREQGKNDALALAIQSCAELMRENQYAVALQTYELPCIQHADGPDYNQLKEILLEQATSVETNTFYDYVVITSPEAARVLASVWPWTDTTMSGTTTSAPPEVAAVGKATEVALRDAGIDVTFVPTKATAQTLVEELPALSSKTNVLYPASAKAADVLANGLEERTGFSVLRLDTYDTVPVQWDATQQEQAQQCQIVCFASPSAIKGWISNMDNIGTNPNEYVAACIGETSAAACRKFGWDDNLVFYPKEQPGMEGWVEAVMEAAATIAADTTYVESIASATASTPTASATK